MSAKHGRDVRGILLLDKPSGPTSNQALQRVKRLYQAAKAGHTGSLDPLATGMLPICFGAATRLAGFLLDASKTYRVDAELGVATETGDAEGAVIGRSETSPPDEASVRAALAGFVGEIEQLPPMYSALKRDGQRLYELARRGVDVERETRRVRIYSAALEALSWPACRFTVTCSKGTYVRTLVGDLAEALGTLGHVTALRRLAVAPFEPGAMVAFDELEQDAEHGLDALDRRLLPIDSALVGWRKVVLDSTLAARLLHGQSVAAARGEGPGLVRVDDARRGFVGIGEVRPDGRLVPRKMLMR